MKTYLLLIPLLFMLVRNSTSQVEEETLLISTIKCNDKLSPISVDAQNINFSWVVQTAAYDKSQSAYQILVSSQDSSVTMKNADTWNSGKILSSQSIYVPFLGESLAECTKYWWKVRIWDESGNVSNWSKASSFETSLEDEKSWHNAKWISLSKDSRESEYRYRPYKTGKMKKPVMVSSQAVGYFRSQFDIEKKIASARVYVCGLGYYELLLNGKKAGDHVLDPAPSNYDKQAYYLTYDVTDLLSKGENTIGLILGNGFYGQSISWKNDPESDRDMSYGLPSARVLLKVMYADGTSKEFITDKGWKNSTGPIVFDNVYGGDTYDARYELGDWVDSNYDDAKWTHCKEVQPKVDKINSSQIPPIRCLKYLTPHKVFKSPRGTWIVDFGQNVAGWVKVSVKEHSGQVINIIPTEALTQDGSDIYPGSTGGGANGMPQLYTYICKGDGIEQWEPMFSYHGFRYAEISGVSTKPDADMIQAVLVATDAKLLGQFDSSSPLLNKMDTISKWTIIDNLHGIPEDCPHREKCGWLGDAHAFCEYALYNFDMKLFYRKYMEDIRTQMRYVPGKNDSSQKFKVPTMIAPGKRTSSIAKLDWGVATMYLPWYNYIYYGDKEIVTEYYDDMKQLTNYYLSFKNEDGIIDNGMGDWCPPRWDRKQNPSAMECDPVVSANAYFYDVLGVMSSMASLVGDSDFEKQMLDEQALLHKAFNEQFLESIPLVGSYWYGSQTATVMALQFGMVPEAKIEKVVEGLVYNIVAVKGEHHSTGIHGHRYIYTVLAKYGYADLAYRLLTTPTFPSQTYVMNYGFTTWPERQFYWDEMEGLTNSLNHPMHSGFATYFYESLAGIKPCFSAPGYKAFFVNPVASSDVNLSEISIPTPYGEITNHVVYNQDGMTLELHVPFNSTAKLVTSSIDLSTLIINDTRYVVPSGDSPGYLVLGSGDYTVHYLPN